MAVHIHPAFVVDEESGESKGCSTQSGRRVDGSMRRQWHSWWTTLGVRDERAWRQSGRWWWRRDGVDWCVTSEATSLEEDSDTGSSFRQMMTKASVFAMATTAMVRNGAMLTSTHDWTVMRRSVDDVRASTGTSRLSDLDSMQRRLLDGIVRWLDDGRWRRSLLILSDDVDWLQRMTRTVDIRQSQWQSQAH